MIYIILKGKFDPRGRFFVRTAEALVPVEVKASNNRSKSLRTLIDSEHYPDIHFGIKLAGTNIGYGNEFIHFHISAVSS